MDIYFFKVETNFNLSVIITFIFLQLWWSVLKISENHIKYAHMTWVIK